MYCIALMISVHSRAGEDRLLFRPPLGMTRFGFDSFRIQEHLDRIRAKFAKRGEAIKDNRIYRKLRRLDDDGPCQRERNRPDVWPIVALPLNRGLAPSCFQYCPRI